MENGVLDPIFFCLNLQPLEELEFRNKFKNRNYSFMS